MKEFATCIRPLLASDWDRVSAIYEAGIKAGSSTFEKSIPSWEDWDRDHRQEPRIVIEIEDDDAPEKNLVVGWAVLTPFSKRSVYSGVAGISIYIDPDYQGHGLGYLLLDSLIARSEESGIWTLQAGIFPENIPSIKLHEKLGFRLVGRRERIGKLNGTWRDSLLYERRSPLFTK